MTKEVTKDRMISIRLPDALRERLQWVASAEYRSVASVVAEAVDRLCEEREARNPR